MRRVDEGRGWEGNKKGSEAADRAGVGLVVVLEQKFVYNNNNPRVLQKLYE